MREIPGLFKQKIEAVEDMNKDNSEWKPRPHTVVGCKSRYNLQFGEQIDRDRCV